MFYNEVVGVPHHRLPRINTNAYGPGQRTFEMPKHWVKQPNGYLIYLTEGRTPQEVERLNASPTRGRLN